MIEVHADRSDRRGWKRRRDETERAVGAWIGVMYEVEKVCEIQMCREWRKIVENRQSIQLSQYRHHATVAQLPCWHIAHEARSLMYAHLTFSGYWWEWRMSVGRVVRHRT